MATNHRCRWVRRRLALLAGDPEGRDLRWDDRRHVERHLIGCTSCRSERDSLEAAVGALRGAGVATTVGPDAPSLWPDLSRQIRASRHARPNPFSLIGFGPSLGMTAGLLVAGTAIGLVTSRIQPPSAPRPAPPVPAVTAPTPRPALPEGSVQTRLASEPQVAPKPDVRLELDPKTGANRDPQRSVGQ